MRLMLLRHAKSDWSANLPDKERQLNQRGRAAAPRMGEYMAESGLVPDRVLCSPAVRASETWTLVHKALPDAPRAEYLEELYDFGSGSTFVRIIREHAGNSKCVLVVGHNPWMEDLAGLLAACGHERQLARMTRKFPTAALAVIDFDFDDWSNLAPQTGRLHRFVRPKDLSPEATAEDRSCR